MCRKTHLTFIFTPNGTHRQVANTTAGFRALLKWVDERDITRLVFEATGAYHRAFEQTMGAAGLPLSKVNPLHTKRFGQALGQPTWTDPMDAAMLARFGALIEPPIRPAPEKIIRDLSELHVARTALAKDLTAAKNRQ